METVEQRAVGMAALTFISRIAAELERQGVLTPGWSAAELRQAAQEAGHDVQYATNLDLQRALVRVLRTTADLLALPPTTPP